MKLNESIGRYSVRKVIRFALNSDHCAAVSLEELIAQDEQRAAFLNMAKAALEAEHLTFVRRVFKALPDPLPDGRVIRAAFEADPEYAILSGRNAAKAMKCVVDRCIANGWTVPESIRALEHWPSLYVKWHWFCQERLQLNGENSLPREWQGRPKADVEKTCALLRAPKRRKPSRNFWYDHAPFRMMFGNQTCGMSWLKEDFAAARTFLLLDGDRLFVGVVLRDSRFTPYAIPDAEAGQPAYRLYEESEYEKPVLRAIPKVSVDNAARNGDFILLELDGRALRNRSNLNARYLRAVFSPENLKDPVFRLSRAAEFHVRKGTDIPREDKDEHFRQRFTEDRLFITLNLTINAGQIAGSRPQPFANLATFVARNPGVRFIRVSESPKGGFIVTPPNAPGPQTFPTSQTSLLVGTLARMAVENDACILFSRRFPRWVRTAVVDKFAYVVLKDRTADEPGGVLRGYQLVDRLFVGDLDECRRDALVASEKEGVRPFKRGADAASTAEERAARKAANRAKDAEDRRNAALRRLAVPPNFSVPPFQTGACRFLVVFKTSDNVRHEAECRADTKDEMFAKARTVGVRPCKVTLIADAPDAVDAAPPANSLASRLKKLDTLRKQGLVTEDEYAAQRTRILSEL